MGVPSNGWFIRDNPTKMGDLGTPISGNFHIVITPSVPDVSN